MQLVEYQSIWPEQFQREAGRIQVALGSRALSIDHVGSTSVPGLAAKLIIDIALTVADSANEAAYVPDLEAAGYQLRIREPDWFEHRLFKGPEVDVNIHMFSRDCVEVERMIVFRDQLRNNDDDRHLYERTKRELASRRWKYVQHYANAKSEVITTILNRSEIGNDRPAPQVATSGPRSRICVAWIIRADSVTGSAACSAEEGRRGDGECEAAGLALRSSRSPRNTTARSTVVAGKRLTSAPTMARSPSRVDQRNKPLAVMSRAPATMATTRPGVRVHPAG